MSPSVTPLRLSKQLPMFRVPVLNWVNFCFSQIFHIFFRSLSHTFKYIFRIFTDVQSQETIQGDSMLTHPPSQGQESFSIDNDSHMSLDSEVAVKIPGNSEIGRSVFIFSCFPSFFVSLNFIYIVCLQCLFFLCLKSSASFAQRTYLVCLQNTIRSTR